MAASADEGIDGDSLDECADYAQAAFEAGSKRECTNHRRATPNGKLGAGHRMKAFACALGAVVAMIGMAVGMARASSQADEEAAPIFGVTVPPGYRDWRLILVAHEEGNLNDLRVQLGNEVAMKAYRDGTRPFPDGTIIAGLHWDYASSEENNKVFGRAQSFVAGYAKNVQFMVKDSKRYAATGGWGFADFRDGKPASEAVHSTCFPCHEQARTRDYVFTRYSP